MSINTFTCFELIWVSVFVLLRLKSSAWQSKGLKSPARWKEEKNAFFNMKQTKQLTASITNWSKKFASCTCSLYSFIASVHLFTLFKEKVSEVSDFLHMSYDIICWNIKQILYIALAREYWMIYRGLGFLAVVWFWLLSHPPPPPLFRQ